MTRIPPIIWVILGMCLLPEVVLSGSDLGLWGDPRWRVMAWQNAGFWAGLLGNWHPNYPLQPVLMFATYGFLHAGASHFIVNMITLISVGIPVEARLGPWRFAILYLASLVGGAIGFAALSTVVAPMVGASGALFGLIGAWIYWEYAERLTLSESLWPVVRAVGGLAALNLILWFVMDGQLAWETHLGGFLAGWVMAAIMERWPRRA